MESRVILLLYYTYVVKGTLEISVKWWKVDGRLLKLLFIL